VVRIQKVEADHDHLVYTIFDNIQKAIIRLKYSSLSLFETAMLVSLRSSFVEPGVNRFRGLASGDIGVAGGGYISNIKYDAQTESYGFPRTRSRCTNLPHLGWREQIFDGGSQAHFGGTFIPPKSSSHEPRSNSTSLNLPQTRRLFLLLPPRLTWIVSTGPWNPAPTTM
jgi:hypothetical protein